MTTEIRKTVRLKKQEAIALKELSYELTKKAINSGIHKTYNEADLVHLYIDELLGRTSIDKEGNLVIEEKNKTK